VCDLINLKSSLKRSPKLKESIEDPFRQEVWLGSVHVLVRVRVKSMTTASEVCEYECFVTSFVL
jgi:hypothetical protein